MNGHLGHGHKVCSLQSEVYDKETQIMELLSSSSVTNAECKGN